MKVPNFLSGHSPYAPSPVPEKVTLDPTENSLKTLVTKSYNLQLSLNLPFQTTEQRTHYVHSKHFKLQNDASLIKSYVYSN